MLAQIVINGIILGGLYACVAVGFSLVWGVLNIINLVHGVFVVLGGYLAWLAWRHFGLHPLLSLPFVALLTGLLGAGLQGLVLNRVVGQPVLITLVVTFGLELLGTNLLLQIFGADYQTIRPSFTLGTAVLGGVRIPLDRAAAAACAVLMTGALWIILRKSWLGRAIIAVRMDRDASRLMGIKVDAIYVLTFGLGAALAGCAGTLLGIVFPISPLQSEAYLGTAFTVCVIGGLGSVIGAAAGGLALGLVESLAAVWVGSNNAPIVSLGLLLLLLALRPEGLFGQRGFA